MKRLAAFACLAFASAPIYGQQPEPLPSLRLRVGGIPVLDGGEVEVGGAVMVPTISVFAGKSGVVRMRGGVVAPIVVLSSAPLGCGIVRQGLPAISGMTKKASAALEARLAPTRPVPTSPAPAWVPTAPKDYVLLLAGVVNMDRGEIEAVEADARSRPHAYQLIAGTATPAPGELRYGSYLVRVARAGAPELAELGGLRNEREAKSFSLVREGARLQARLDLREKDLTVQGSVPLELCPALEHIHIEPK
jgi:hypothetical protein